MRKSVAIIAYLIICPIFTFGQMSRVKIDNLYSMKILDIMAADESLNNQASLQASNLELEKYIIVIHEPKSEFVEVMKKLGEYDESVSVVDNLANAQISVFSEGLEVLDKSEITKKRAHGMALRRIDIDANIAGIDSSIAYFFGYVEGEETLYTIMAWTLLDMKDEFKREVEKMIKSIKEQ